MLRSGLLRLSLSLSILLGIATLTAQETDTPPATAKPAPGNRIVCDLPAPELPFFRADDGRVPANWARAGAPEEAGVPDGDLRTTALTALAIIADGSTLRSGPHKQHLKATIRWLRAQQDDEGRFGLRTDSAWWLDEAITTYAIGEAGRVSSYALLQRNFESGVGALTNHLRHLERNVDPELLLWCRLSVLAGIQYEERIAQAQKNADAPPWDSGVKALDAEIRRLTTESIPSEDRARAARLLLELRSERAPDPEFVAALRPAFVLDDRSLEDVDPLALLYATTASYLEGAPSWQSMQRRLKDSIVASQSTDKGTRQTWAPQGEFGARYGRNGMTAARIMVLCLYYRYSALVMAGS